jgi:hypothetical protein
MSFKKSNSHRPNVTNHVLQTCLKKKHPARSLAARRQRREKIAGGKS